MLGLRHHGLLVRYHGSNCTSRAGCLQGIHGSLFFSRLTQSQHRYHSSQEGTATAATPMPQPLGNGGRLLFFGGDAVSLVALEAIHRKLRRSGPSTSSSTTTTTTSTSSASSLTSSYSSAQLKESPLVAVCPPIPPCGSPNPVMKYCLQNDIPCYPAPHPRSLVKPTEEGRRFYLPHLHPDENMRCPPFDVACVVSFRYFLGPSILKQLPKVINMHPSTLPKYRGASPIISTVLRGEPVGGVSIIKIVTGEKMDSGDILHSATIPIPPTQTVTDYFEAVTKLGAERLLHVLCGDRPSGIDVARIDAFWNAARVQDCKYETLAEDPYHAPLLFKKDMKAALNDMDPASLYNHWRAFPTHLFCTYDPTKSPIAHTIKNPAKKAPRRVIIIEAVHPTQLSPVQQQKDVFEELRGSTALQEAPVGSFYHIKAAGGRHAAVKCGKVDPSTGLHWMLLRTLRFSHGHDVPVDVFAASISLRPGELIPAAFS